MTLGDRLRAIAAAQRPSTKGRAAELKRLKQEAESLTKQHEDVKNKVDRAAHEYAKKQGFGPSTDPVHHYKYEEHKNHYVQHNLQRDNPDLYKQMLELQHRAPQARVAYKRALRQ